MCIRQNNAVEIYEDYFESGDEATCCETPESKVCLPFSFTNWATSFVLELSMRISSHVVFVARGMLAFPKGLMPHCL